MSRLVKFEKKDCSPCNSVSSYLDSLNVQYERVNPFNNPELAIQYGIMSVPVVLLLAEDGTELARSVGFRPEELKSIIEML